MSRPGTTQAKRAREQARDERAQEKQKLREDRKKDKENRVVRPGEDPDIAGIIPGPQPIQED